MTDLSAIGGTSSSVTTQTPDPYAELTSDEFLEIIFTELANQDPLQPSDTSALLEQLSSIRDIQSDIDLADQLSTVVKQNELTAASGMIGKLVSGQDETNRSTLGLVDSVSRSDETVTLNLSNGSRVPLSNVQEIVELTEAELNELFGLAADDGTTDDEANEDTTEEGAA